MKWDFTFNFLFLELKFEDSLNWLPLERLLIYFPSDLYPLWAIVKLYCGLKLIETSASNIWPCSKVDLAKISVKGVATL